MYIYNHKNVYGTLFSRFLRQGCPHTSGLAVVRHAACRKEPI